MHYNNSIRLYNTIVINFYLYPKCSGVLMNRPNLVLRSLLDTVTLGTISVLIELKTICCDNFGSEYVIIGPDVALQHVLNTSDIALLSLPIHYAF